MRTVNGLIVTLMGLLIAGCSTGQRSGMNGFAICKEYHFQCVRETEADMLRDVEKLAEVPGVVSIRDFRLDNLSLLTVACSPDCDVSVRKAVLALGYKALDQIPVNARIGSRTQGKKWNQEPNKASGSSVAPAPQVQR